MITATSRAPIRLVPGRLSVRATEIGQVKQEQSLKPGALVVFGISHRPWAAGL